MANKNQVYKRNLERYKKFLEGTPLGQELGYQFLEHPSTAKRKADLVYSIMEGSYRNQSGVGGVRTFRGKRVDTYEGRIAAVVDILGLDNSRYFASLEKLISKNNYLNSTKSKNVANEGAFRSEVVGNYVRGLKEGAIKVEKKLGSQVQDLTKRLDTSDGLLTVVTKHRDELDSTQRTRISQIKELKEENKKQEEELTQTYRTALDLCLEAKHHRFWKNIFATGLAASLLISAIGFGCSRDKKEPVIKSEDSHTIINKVSQVRNYFPVSFFYPKLASPKDSLCYRGIKKSDSNLNGGVTPEQLRKFYDSNPLAMPNNSEPSEDVFAAEPAPAEVIYPMVGKVADAQIKPTTNGLYRTHVDFRNLNSRDTDGDSLDDRVSANPVYFGRALKNEGKDLTEAVLDTTDLGYAGKEKSRLKNFGRALVSPVDSALGLVSGGRLGLHKDTREARSEDNLLLGSIRSVYDGVQSISRGVVDGTDLVAGGLADKLVYDVVGGSAKALVNSTVDAGNFVFAVPLDASQRFENWAFKNKGKVSMETYELASTIMRFGGNVVLHEAPFDGKYVEVTNEAGEKVLINKGQTGATLESLMAVLLDAGVLSSHKSGGNGGNSEGGSWNWNSSGSPGGDVGSFGSSGSGGGI
jgi:hypothetical protein